MRLAHEQLVVLVIVFLLMGQLVGCSPSEQNKLETLVVEAGETIVAEGGSFAKTQAALLKHTTEARFLTEVANIRSTVAPGKFHETIVPPFDACIGKSVSINSPLLKSEEIIEEGFGNTSYYCDAERGAIRNTVLLFGGKNGSIQELPNYETDVSSGMEFGFMPPFTGKIRIDATYSVSSKTGAAAGSAAALLDFQDIILAFLLPTQLGAFLEISESIIFQTGAGVRTDAYIYIDSDSSHNETTTLIGGRGFGASFPLPPHSQSMEFSSERVNLSLTTPVKKGQRIFIGAGIKTTAKVHGWAVAYWNPHNESEVIVMNIELTEE